MQQAVVRGRLFKRAHVGKDGIEAMITWTEGTGATARTFAVPTRYATGEVSQFAEEHIAPFVEAEGIIIRAADGTRPFLAARIRELRPDVKGGAAS